LSTDVDEGPFNLPRRPRPSYEAVLIHISDSVEDIHKDIKELVKILEGAQLILIFRTK